MIAGIVIAFIVILFLWSIFAYNRIVTSRNDVQNAWSQTDLQLKRRHDLIPGLVTAVRGYMDHERHILERSGKDVGARLFYDRRQKKGMLCVQMQLTDS